MSKYSSLSYEWACEQAEEANCVIEIASDNQLQLDLDSDAAYDVFVEQRERLTLLGMLPKDATYTRKRSRSGNWHVVVTMPGWSKPVEDRILLQTLLGSDRTREALSLARSRAGNPYPILLFRPCFLVEDRDGAPYAAEEQWYRQLSPDEMVSF